MNDEHFLRLALELAGKGAGQVSPNPMVGCVLVKEGKVIGRGYHQKYGGPHAEVNAINSAEADLTGAVMYVSLEPCSHFGKTPPCADLIISKGISRVVVGALDPNPLVSGKGVKKLIESGIDVTVPLLEDECKERIKFFLKHITTGMPYILVKTAASLNGKVNRERGRPSQLTCTESAAMVHRLRGEYDLILTGSGTVTADDPVFTVRKAAGRNPAVAILDSSLSISPSARLFTAGRKVYIFTAADQDRAKAELLREKGAEVIEVGKDEQVFLSLHEVFSVLGRKGIGSVMAESGPRLTSSLLASGFTDEFLIYITTEMIAGGENFIHPEFGGVPQGSQLLHTATGSSGTDICLTFRTEKSLKHVYRSG